MNMIQKLKGWWWLPNDRDKVIAGTARFKQGSAAKVKLFGALPLQDPRSNIDFPIILGSSRKQRYATLLNSYEKIGSVSRDWPPLPETITSLRADTVVIGAHVSSSDPSFTSISTDITNLNHWCNIERGVEEHWDENVYRLTAPVKDPVEPIVCPINDGFELVFVFVNRRRFAFDRQYGIKTDVQIRVSSQEPRPLTQFMKIVSRLKELLALFIQQPVFVSGMSGVLDREFVAEHLQHSNYVLIVHNWTRHHVPSDKYHDFMPSQMLISLGQIKEDLPTVIRNWYSETERFDLAYHLYFSVIFAPFTYVDTEFLYLAQVLEGYHRRIVYDSTYISPEKYQKVLKEIVRSVPSDLPGELRGRIKGELSRANDWSLANRIYDVLKRRGDKFLNTFFGSNDEQKIFAQQVSATRNYLSHLLEPDQVRKKFSDSQLPEARERLRILVEASLLEIAGLTKEKIDEVLIGRTDRILIRNHYG